MQILNVSNYLKMQNKLQRNTCMQNKESNVNSQGDKLPQMNGNFCGMI